MHFFKMCSLCGVCVCVCVQCMNSLLDGPYSMWATVNLVLRPSHHPVFDRLLLFLCTASDQNLDHPVDGEKATVVPYLVKFSNELAYLRL